RPTGRSATRCRGMIMAAEARLGGGLRGQSKPLGRDEVQFYEDVARRRGRCPAIILKMFDKDMEVLEATQKGAVWYVDKRREKEEAGQGIVVTRREPVLVAGGAALYTAAQAQKFHLCNLTKESRQEVAEAYQMPPTSLR